MYDVVVVGTGFAGSILARKIAEELDKKVLVIEKRNHIAGNMYDEIDENGILVQRYGPHFLCTNEWCIVEFLSKYGEWFVWQPRAMSFVDNKYIWRPYNFHTLQQLLGPENSGVLLKKMKESFPMRRNVSIYELVNHEDTDIANYGQLLYEKLYIPYISKQWGKKPNEIDRSIVDRAKVSLGYDWQLGENIDFQYLPKEGYTKLFAKILDHPNIKVELEKDALEIIELSEMDKKVKVNGKAVNLLVFTGPIDELFKQKYGKLPYRSRHFEYKTYETKDFELPTEVVTYPQEEPYIRKTEYKRINYFACEHNVTTIAEEYSLEYDKAAMIGNEPYYPVLNEDSLKIYEQYKKEADEYKNLILCGRLAEYRYLDMHTVIEHAFSEFEKIRRML